MIINTGARTDTVQYYTQWLLNRFDQGFVYSRNPMFPDKVTRYELIPEKVDCVIFCSKNYSPILPDLHKITDKFNTYFFYTITAYGKDIEPGVPSIDQSIDTLIKLEKQVGKERIAWRYDPVLFTKTYTIQKHLITFEHMAARLSGHVSRCIFSFVEFYKKLEYNMSELIVPTEEEMDYAAAHLAEIARKYRIPLQTCATKKDYSSLGVLTSGCITLDILAKANNLKFKDLKHNGTRKNCHCIINHDIGTYDSCPNGCKYCYANSSPELARENYKKYDPESPILLDTLKDTDIIYYARQKSFLKDSSRQLTLF